MYKHFLIFEGLLIKPVEMISDAECINVVLMSFVICKWDQTLPNWETITEVCKVINN